MAKLYFFPQYPQGKSFNPYCDNFLDSIKGYFDIVRNSNLRLPRGLELLYGSFRADYYILNWLESISSMRCGSLQAIMGVLALIFIKFRGKDIIWMFHNIHPHEGEGFWSSLIQKLLFKWSSLIVAHSQEATDYAHSHTKCPVFYRPHPFKKKTYGVWSGDSRESDFLLWGDIYPYKGIVEFLKNPLLKQGNISVFIIGKPTSEELLKQIECNLSANIRFENRRAGYDEIAILCKKSKYVLFPYVGDSISSSGVLMDTLQMGGTPVGPNKGAFADLQRLGCCITYNNINEVFSFLCNGRQSVRLESKNVDSFIEQNSWEAFGVWLYKTLITKG